MKLPKIAKSPFSFHRQIERFAWANGPGKAVRFTFHTPTPVKCEMKGNEREIGQRKKESKKSFFESPHTRTRAREKNPPWELP